MRRTDGSISDTRTDEQRLAIRQHVSICVLRGRRRTKCSDHSTGMRTVYSNVESLQTPHVARCDAITAARN